MVLLKLALEPAGGRPYHKRNCNQILSRRQAGLLWSRAVPRLLALRKDHRRTFSENPCHPSSCQKCRTKRPPQRLGRWKGPQEISQKAWDPLLSAKLDDLIQHKVRTESCQTSQKIRKMLVNKSLLKTYTEPQALFKPAPLSHPPLPADII